MNVTEGLILKPMDHSYNDDTPIIKTVQSDTEQDKD